MPYNSYTNESDTQFATQLDDYKLGLKRGAGVSDYDAAVAGFNVLPESMAVGQLMAMRSQAHRSAMGTRKEVAEDQSAGMAEDEFQGFSERVRGMAGMSGEDRAQALQDELLNNPNLLRNKDAMDVTRGLFETDKYSIQARSNALASQKQRIDSRMMDEEESTMDDRIKLGRELLGNSIQQAKLQREQTDLTIGAIADKKMESVGQYVASSKGFTPEEAPYRDMLIKVAAHYSKNADDETNRNSLTALAQITGALSEASQMPEIFRAKMSQHSNLLEGLKRRGFDLTDSSLPPEEVASRVAQAQIFLRTAKGVTPADIAAFEDVVDIRAGIDRSQAELAETKSSLFATLEKIDALRSNPSPEAQAQIEDELALLRAKAPALSAHYRKAVNDQDSDLKRREMESKIENRLSLAKNRIRSADQKDRSLAQSEYRTEMQNAFRLATTRESRIRLYTKVAEDGTFDLFGFDKDPAPDEFLSKLESINPLPGVSSNDY